MEERWHVKMLDGTNDKERKVNRYCARGIELSLVSRSTFWGGQTGYVGGMMNPHLKSKTSVNG